MSNLTYDNKINRMIVAEMRDNQNRQDELFGKPTMMPYRSRPTLTGGVMVLSGNNPTSNMGCRDGLITQSPMIVGEEMSGGAMRGNHAGMRTEELEGGAITFTEIIKKFEDGVKLIPLKTRRQLSKKGLDAIKNIDAKDVAVLAGSGWFEKNILGNVKKMVDYIPIDVRRQLAKNTVKFINALDADDVKTLRGSGLCVAECKRRSKKEGGSFWDDVVKKVSKTVKSGRKLVKKGITKAVPIIKDVAKEVKQDVEATVKLIPPKIRNAIKNKTIELAPELLSGALSAAALAAGQPELVPVAGIVGNVAGKAIGAKLKGGKIKVKKPVGAANDGRANRAAIVKKIMKDRGVSMINASKIVKAENLYKKN